MIKVIIGLHKFWSGCIEGNCAQLLGRVYFRLTDLTRFEQMMREAEHIARNIDQVDNSLHGQYCLGTVYVDYARSYNQPGQFQRSLEYIKNEDYE